MAMGANGRRNAENAIACCRPFKNSTGSFYGTRGSTRTLGWLETHNEAARIRELLSEAVYVVWSYGTPIAFVVEDEDGERTAYYVDDSHSMTTSHHQGVARCGMGEYETIGERRPVRRPRRAPVRRDDSSLVAAVGPQPYSEPVGTNYSSRVQTDPDFIAQSEGHQEQVLRRLLDPRYADPNWTPFGDWAERAEAERRDMRRIESDGRTDQTHAHP